jgi:hypothetical protein
MYNTRQHAKYRSAILTVLNFKALGERWLKVAVGWLVNLEPKAIDLLIFDATPALL